MENLQTRIESVIDEKLRPQLLLHGGGMETVRLDTVYFLKGKEAEA